MTELDQLQTQAAQLQARLAELRQSRERTSKEADSLRDSLSGIRARHSTLNRILNDHSYTGEAVQKLFAANERHGGQDFRAVGVLADYAEVQEQHETAIEQYCARNWSMSWWKPTTMRARASACCARKSAGAQRSSSILYAI